MGKESVRKVWIVLEIVPYEGFNILGVFDSEDKARRRVAEARKEGFPLFDYKVEEWRVE